MFFTIEGIEGSGKSSIIKKLNIKLLENNLKVKITSEPRGNNISLGKKIRKLIIKNDINPLTEFLLFSSFRSEHISKYIKPWINDGFIIVCDRFIHSSIAYQGLTKNIDTTFIKNVNDYILDNLIITKVFLIDLDPEIAQKRISSYKRINKDRFDQESLAFHKKIRDNYLKLADDDKKIIVIKGDQEINLIVEEIFIIMKKEIEMYSKNI